MANEDIKDALARLEPLALDGQGHIEDLINGGNRAAINTVLNSPEGQVAEKCVGFLQRRQARPGLTVRPSSTSSNAFTGHTLQCPS